MRTRFLFLLGTFFYGTLTAHASLFSHEYTVSELQTRLDHLPETGQETARGRLLTELGKVYFRDGRVDDAMRVLEEAAALSPRPAVARDLFRYLGRCYESQGRLDKTIWAYEYAVKYDLRNWRRWRDLAQQYEAAKLFQKAVETFHKAIKLAPKKETLYFGRARNLVELGFYREAEHDLIISMDLGHMPGDVFRVLSRVMEGRGRYEEAAESWKESLADDASDADWCRLLYLYVLAGDERQSKIVLATLSERDLPSETMQFYSSLVQGMSSSPQRTLLGK